MVTDPSDESLLSRARDGDPAAWRELHDRIGGRLVVWLRAQPQPDAALAPEDLANEAWCTAATRIADFSGDADAFAGWVFGIARNHLRNLSRRSQRRATAPVDADDLELVAHAGPGQDRIDAISRCDQLDWIRGLLARLPAREAEVVACIDVVGLDVASTAAALSLTANAVRVSHHRALKRLRAMLASDGPAPAATVVTPPSRSRWVHWAPEPWSRSGGWIAEPDTVVAPERLGVHQGAGHPRLVRRLRHDLERRLGDTQATVVGNPGLRRARSRSAGSNAASPRGRPAVRDESGPQRGHGAPGQTRCRDPGRRCGPPAG